MGFRTKGRARRLPQLIADLEAGRAQITKRQEALGDAVSDEQRKGVEYLLTRTAEHLKRAHDYSAEFEQEGRIADSEFDGWFKNAQAFANVAQMTPEEFQATDRIASRLPGGPK